MNKESQEAPSGDIFELGPGTTTAPAPGPAPWGPATSHAVAMPPTAQPLAAGVVPGSPAHLLMVAVERGASLEYLERLIALQERMEANTARNAYNEALAGFKAEVIEIIKRKRVHFSSQRTGTTTDYRHAELSDVVEAVGPALSKHGFGWNWTLQQQKQNAWIEVTCVLRHRLGHSETVMLGGPPDDTGNKNSVQQITSTITLLERATLKAITGTSEKGDDNDGRGKRKNGEASDEPAGGEMTEEQTQAYEALLDAGRAKSLEGMKPLTEWWKNLTEPQRKQLNSEFGSMRKAAGDADRGAKA